jgi:hypothetical protein
MKIDNQDIIRTARQLRDEENAELQVSPWNRHRHFHVPTWLVAIPAAAIIGFVLGLWTQANSHSDVPLTALVDTVYIKVPTPQPQQDSVAQAIPTSSTPTVTKPSPRQTVRTMSTSNPTQKEYGRPVADDHIRYDLLVKN